eukprot:gb/GFBE01004017.1/.p1 GENE.gb/GFBE01004017.1/~~gb/GFBE01004017.1/.p1  ORF type:complete len:403 (+),score=71.47 gb/GFBE01004017.1/:1-1209(+)
MKRFKDMMPRKWQSLQTVMWVMVAISPVASSSMPLQNSVVSVSADGEAGSDARKDPEWANFLEDEAEDLMEDEQEQDHVLKTRFALLGERPGDGRSRHRHHHHHPHSHNPHSHNPHSHNPHIHNPLPQHKHCPVSGHYKALPVCNGMLVGTGVNCTFSDEEVLVTKNHMRGSEKAEVSPSQPDVLVLPVGESKIVAGNASKYPAKGFFDGKGRTMKEQEDHLKHVPVFPKDANGEGVLELDFLEPQKFTRFRIWDLRWDWSFKQIAVYVSNDRTDYSEVGNWPFEPTKCFKNCANTEKAIKFDSAVLGRFLKFKFTCDKTMVGIGIPELEVYGQKGKCAPQQHFMCSQLKSDSCKGGAYASSSNSGGLFVQCAEGPTQCESRALCREPFLVGTDSCGASEEL